MTVSFRSFSAFRLVVFCLASLFLGASFTDKISAQPVWSPIGNSSLISPSDIFPSFSAIGVNANTIFVPKSANNVWTLHRSLDNGTTWTTLSDPSVPVSPFSFHFNGSATFAYQFGDGLFRSFNNGTTWSRIDFVGSAPSAARLVALTWDDVQIPTNYDQLIQSVALLRDIKDSVDAERRVYNVLTKALNNQYTIPRFGTFKSTSFPEIVDEDYNFILAAHSELTLDPAPELLALVNGDKSTLPQVNNDEDAVFAVIAKAMSSSALEPIPGYGWFVSLSRSAYIDANGMTQPAQKYPVFIRHSPLYRKQTTISGAAFSCYVYPRFGDFENGSIVWNLEHFCNDSVNALQYPFLQPYQPLRTPPSPAARASGVTGVYGTAMAGDGNSIFIAVANDHIYRTLDNGVSWAKVDNNLPSYGTVPNRYLDFFIFDTDVQGTTVFVVGNRGIFRSLDNGNSWTNVKAESSTETINSIICNGTRVLAYASSGKIYRSTDNGNSWQQVTVLPTQPTTGCKLVQGDGVVFAATESAGVHYSSDDGITWKKIADTNPLLDAKLTAFAANSTSIFATTGVPGLNNNVYRMTGYSTLPRTDVSYAISGMSGINGASLALSGTATSSTTASATGAYSFSGLANGTYTVTPTLTGYVFVPSSTSVTISGASLSGVNFQTFTAPPPAPATVLTFSSVGASSATLTWNPPAGGAQNYIVVIRAGGTPSYTPQNGTSPTGVNSNFTLASALADGSRIVYDGSGTSVSLTGLSPQTSYTVVVFPSNGSGAMRSYQINAPLTGTQSTSALPQLQITPASLDFGSVTVSTVSTGSLTISGTSLLAAVNVTAANPALSLSLTNTPFTTQAVLSLTPTNGVLGATQIFVRFSPSVIGAYTSTLTVSSLNATSAVVTVNGAGIQSQNQYSIFGSIGIASGVVTLGGAATQSTSASSVGAYSFSTLANGVYTVTPTLTGYVFVPSSTSVTIGGASAYGVNFQPFTVPPSAAATTLVFSSVNASSATIAWNPPVGGAQSYIVVVRSNGTPSYSPANGTTSTGVNSDITLANALADGSRIVYDGSGTSLLLTGLSPQTSYTVVVFPSNGAGALRSYQTISPLTSSFVTLPPSRITLTPSALNFGSVTLGTVSTASFSVNGDGLTEALVLTSSGASFSLSLTGSPFTTQASLSLVPVSNTILPTTVFVRFTPSVTGASIGAILASGASTATLLLNGTGTTPIPPPVLKAAYAGVRTPIDVTDLQAFTVTFRNAANALVDYPGAVDFRGGTPLGASTGTLTLTRLSLGTYQASSVFTGTGSYTLSLVGVTSTSGTRTFTVQASVNNPTPTLSSIAPATTTATTSTWTLTLNGSNFLPESRVIVDGVTLDQQNVSFVSGALLKAQVVQPLAGIYSVVVENPTPGGGTSLPRTLTVNHPAPRLAAIEPVSVVAGQDAVLTLYGGYFTTATVVRFQNGAVTTTLAVLSLLSPTMATVTIPGSLITISGTYQIRAHTPVLGGGTSAAENLLVRGAAAVSAEFVNVTTSVVSGTNLNAFTVRFRDSFGNLTNVASPVLGYGESTGAITGTIPLKYTSTGVSTATATRMDIGGTYSLWINGIGTTTGSRTYTVTGGNDARVTFSGVPVSVTAGTVVPAFALRFEDAAGNLTDNGVGRLTYTRSGGSSTATLALTRLSTGMYTAQSTVCTIAGAYNLAVSSVTPANTFGTKAFTLTPSDAVRSTFSAVTLSINAGAQQTAFDVRFFDAFNNPTDYAGNVQYNNTTSATNGTSTGTITLTRTSLGLYDAARVAFTTAGNYTLAASNLINTGGRFFTVSSSTTVRFVDFMALPPKVYPFAEQTVSIFYRDVYGNRIESNRTITFTKSGLPSSTGTLSLSRGSTVGETVASFSAITLPGTYTLTVSGLGASEIRTLPGDVGLPKIQVFENEGNIMNVCFEGIMPSIYAGNLLPNFTARYILNDGNPSITYPREVKYENVNNPSINGTIPMRRLTFGQGQSRTNPLFTVAGIYRLFVAESGITPSCEFTFEVIGATAASITAVTPPNTCIIAGQALTPLQFEVRDRWGNLTNVFNNDALAPTPHIGTFTATPNASSGTISLSTSATGILTEIVPRTFTTAGTYSLNVPIYYGEDRVAETTATFCVEPDIAHKAVFSSVCPVIFSTETIPPVQVTVRDRFNNLASYGGNLLFSSTATVVSAPLTRLQQGIYQTQPMTISTAGIYTLNLPSVIGITTTTIRTGLVVSSVLAHETNALNVYWGDVSAVAVLRRGIEFGRIRAGETSPSQVATFYFSYNDILASDNTSSYTMRVVNVPRGIEFSVDSGRTYQTWNNNPVEFQRRYFKWESLKNAPWIPRDPVFVAPIYIRATSAVADSINAFITVEFSTCLGTRVRDSVRLTARWIEERITSDVQRVDMPDLFTAGATVTETVNVNYENVNTLTITAPTGFLVSTPTCSTPSGTCTVTGGASGTVAVTVHLTATNAVNYFGALRIAGATAFSAIPLAGTRYDNAVYTDSIPKVQMLVLYSPLANTFILNENMRPANNPYCVWKQQYKYGRDIFDYIAQNIDLSNQTNYNSGAFIRFGLDPIMLETTATVNISGVQQTLFPLHDGTYGNKVGSFNELHDTFENILSTPNTNLNLYQNIVKADMVAYIGDPQIDGRGAAQATSIGATNRRASGFTIDMNRCNIDSFVWAHEAGHVFGGGHHDYHQPSTDNTSKGLMLPLYTLEGAMCDLPAGKIINLRTIMAQGDPGRIPHWSDPNGFYRAPQTRQIYPTSNQELWEINPGNIVSVTPNERNMVNNGGARVARFYQEDIDAYITGQPIMSNGGTRAFSVVTLRGTAPFTYQWFTKQFGPSQQQAIPGATGQTYTYTMSGSEKQVILRVVITDAAGRRVTAEKFITCRDCTPAALRVAARSASPFGSEATGFTATSSLFSSGFSCGTHSSQPTTIVSQFKNANTTQSVSQNGNLPTSEINIAQDGDDSDVPSTMILEQNHPNPFGHETTIRFALPTANNVTLTVYDVFGRAVMNIIEGRLSAGKHSFVVVMNSFPSGTYSYRLVTNEGFLTRQMILVR